MKLENLNLAVEIREAIDEVNAQIKLVQKDAESRHGWCGANPSPTAYLKLKHEDGTYVVTPMLETKATLLLALSNLHVS